MSTSPRTGRTALAKTPSGIDGLDAITHGGFPRGRPTLVCGNAGCGKTLLGLQFLVDGARNHGEPGVFVSFEEPYKDLQQNCESLGFALDELVDSNQLRIEHIEFGGEVPTTSGEYDLEGLFIRLGSAIDAIGARRVVIDTLEVLFDNLDDAHCLRREIHRLFMWLKQRGITAVITAERAGTALTRAGLEEFVSDCVIVLDHRVSDQVSARRLRVVKYRGSRHGTNEYPFLIGDTGISLLPVTELRLEHVVSEDRITSGNAALDAMLDGRGYFRGSSILVAGTAGTGKSTIACTMAEAAARAGQRTLMFAYEESPSQIVRNMRSVGVDLQPWIDQNLIRVISERPSSSGLEEHLLRIVVRVRADAPQLVILDPLNSFTPSEGDASIKGLLMRLLDLLKSAGITALCTNLLRGDTPEESSNVGISSLMDTWIVLQQRVRHGARGHTMSIIKSRGMAHSRRVHPYHLSADGLTIDEIASSETDRESP